MFSVNVCEGELYNIVCMFAPRTRHVCFQIHSRKGILVGLKWDSFSFISLICSSLKQLGPNQIASLTSLWNRTNKIHCSDLVCNIQGDMSFINEQAVWSSMGLYQTVDNHARRVSDRKRNSDVNNLETSNLKWQLDQSDCLLYHLTEVWPIRFLYLPS